MLVAEFGERHLLAASGKVLTLKGEKTMPRGSSSGGRRPITRKGGKLTSAQGCHRQNIQMMNFKCIEAALIDEMRSSQTKASWMDELLVGNDW